MSEGKALDLLEQFLSSLNLSKTPSFHHTNLNVVTPAPLSEKIYDDDDDDDTIIRKLRAKVVQMKKENSEFADRYVPQLPQRTSIIKLMKNAAGYTGRNIAVAGWIRTVRSGGGGKFYFLKLYDGTISNELQIIVDNNVKGFSIIQSAAPGAALLIHGDIVPSMGKEQTVEMQATNIKLLGPCDSNSYPLAGKRLSLEHLRKHAHLRPRSIVYGAINRVRNTLAYATHNFFQHAGFSYVHTPLITGSDCEGAGEMFQVTTLIKDGEFDPKCKRADGTIDWSQDFFKKPAFLTVSGQLNGECFATALSSIYTFGPTFRAENSNTTRHLSEFWMIEPEIAFADLKENMNVAEGYLKYAIQQALERCPGDMKILEDFAQRNLTNDGKKKVAKKHSGGKKGKGKKVATDWLSLPLRERLKNVVDSNFVRITYTEVIEVLINVEKEGKKQFEEKPVWGIDLGAEHERYLCEVHFHGTPVIVTDYPTKIKAFYMRLSEDKKTVAAMDVLVPGVGEIIGGSQREERLDVICSRMAELKLDEEHMKWYLDLRRYGSVPHSGFGLGFERLVTYACGLGNIKDSIPFARFPGHAEF